MTSSAVVVSCLFHSLSRGTHKYYWKVLQRAGCHILQTSSSRGTFLKSSKRLLTHRTKCRLLDRKKRKCVEKDDALSASASRFIVLLWIRKNDLQAKKRVSVHRDARGSGILYRFEPSARSFLVIGLHLTALS